MLRLPDDWVWDSWIADDGERYHLYLLRASRALLDPTLRHARATIGHASSLDLREWTYHGEAALVALMSGWLVFDLYVLYVVIRVGWRFLRGRAVAAR
ncbi:hypothetical protein [Jatrophihabitans sp.]|uniref:hypothetical protein n=1 Tax=Jatrophihabitans sp. TaxID=1932789 RepID=UPI002F249710